MLTVDWFRDKRITVMGLGIHGGGLGAAKWLLRHGARLTVTDLKDQHALASSISELERFYLRLAARGGKDAPHRARYVLGRHDEEDFAGADMIVQNPGVPREHLLIASAQKRGIPVESDISIFFQLCPFPITAVTGTKGKTTTTALLAAIAKEHDARTVVGGNIRISVLGALDGLLSFAKRRAAAVAPPVILELSSWQLESLAPRRISPHVSIITNVKEDHLNRYRDMDDYAAAKELIFKFQSPDDIAVLNADNEWTRRIGQGGLSGARAGEGKRLWFSEKPVRGDGCFVRAGRAVMRFDGRETALFPISVVKLPGRHNIANVLAAIAAASAIGVPAKIIARVVREFRGVPGRLEEVAVKNGARFINDTTATTPDAAIAAMETFGALRRRRLILIAGGTDKKLRFDEWAKNIKRRVKHLLLFDGSATEKMETALSTAGANVSMIGARSMRQAVDEAVRHAKAGDVVLLSPGCASFGLFQHEFDRGDQFVKAVRRLK